MFGYPAVLPGLLNGSVIAHFSKVNKTFVHPQFQRVVSLMEYSGTIVM
jgi:hypothetical protein